MNNPISKLEEEVRIAKRDLSPQELISALYPNIEKALDAATTIEDINTVRRQIEAITKYVNRNLPKSLNTRKEYLRLANKGNDLYLRACQKAGIGWEKAEKFTGRPPEYGKGPKLTCLEVGFSSNRDARNCVKASNIGENEYQQFRNNCDEKGRQYTLGGLIRSITYPDGNCFYIFSLGFDNLYKIGKTHNWRDRLYSLQAGNPKLSMHKIFPCKHAETIEVRLKDHFKSQNVGGRECFRLSEEDLQEAIHLIEKLIKFYCFI